MKKMIFLFLMTIPFYGFCQLNDSMKWSFSAKKLSDGVYEIHMKADLESGWHTYSQTTPEGGPLPTSITFIKNPLIIFEDKIKEIGSLEQKFESMFNVVVKQYSGTVDFVQVVRLKGKAKTSVAGTVEAMVCDNHQCLPPKSVKFSVPLK